MDKQSECTGEIGGIKSITIIKMDDIVFGPEGSMIRIKRKYGKNKREIYKLTDERNKTRKG